MVWTTSSSLCPQFRQPVFQRGHLVRTERSGRFEFRSYEDFVRGSSKSKVDEVSTGISLECLDQLRSHLRFKQVIRQRLDSVETYAEARLRPFFHRYAGGAKAESKVSWNGRESFEKAAPNPWFAKTQFTHSQRLTAVMASEKVVSTLPAHSTRPAARARTGNKAYNTATTEYNPNRHGASRNTVASFHPRVVSSPK